MKKSLLIVDDEPNIARSLARVFSDIGYEIHTANSGSEALNFLRDHPIQVIISDQRMPVMSGIEFLAQVKKQYPDIICMILSGYADFETVQTAINEGLAYKFLNKPWENDILVSLVAQAFKEYEDRLQEKDKLKRDQLTGILNRFGFIAYLEQKLKIQ